MKKHYEVGDKKPPKEFQFKKGQSGNPHGGRKHDPELKAVKNLTKKELVEIGNMIIKNDYSKILELSKNDNTPALKRALASVIVKIAERGDMTALDVLLNRLIGKVKDEILHQGDIMAPPQIVLTMPDNGRSVKPNDDYGF